MTGYPDGNSTESELPLVKKKRMDSLIDFYNSRNSVTRSWNLNGSSQLPSANRYSSGMTSIEGTKT